MELKKYQQRAISEIKSFLETVAAERSKGNKHASLDAWDAVGKKAYYHRHTNGLEADVPTVCVKVPTGGGKTLLATQILGLIYQTILKERNGAGLALWVV